MLPKAKDLVPEDRHYDEDEKTGCGYVCVANYCANAGVSLTIWNAGAPTSFTKDERYAHNLAFLDRIRRGLALIEMLEELNAASRKETFKNNLS